MLSIVVPIHNEELVIGELLRRLAEAVGPIGPYELVLVDDASTDKSWELMHAAAAEDSRLRLVRLSRNFGHQVAITAGMDAAQGDAVITMDGDLQDPPEVIPQFVAKWREGYDVVYGIRADRETDSAYKRVTASIFYRLIARLSHVDIPAHAGDFRLLSRRALDALGRMPERARFLRGMSAWIGFKQVGVPYRRDERYAGETKYPTRKMLRFATDAITSFSSAPLRFVSGIGFVCVIFCIGFLAYTVYVKAFTSQAVQGWTTVVVLILLLGGIQLMSLGVVGQYVARIFEESKRRPLYLVDEVFQAEPAEQAREPVGDSSS